MPKHGDSISTGNITGTGIAIGPGATAIVNQAAPAIGVQALHQLPSPPADFTGREPELAELRQAITAGEASIVGLRGLDGVGKTALALRLADELKDHFPDGLAGERAGGRAAVEAPRLRR